MILVVDDDDDVREMVTTALESRGYTVRTASSGSAALEVLETEQPCLVLLDLVMPGVDGFAVMQQLHARARADIPVCVLSALPEKAPPGVVGTLRKPFALADLIALADRYCTAEHHGAGV